MKKFALFLTLSLLLSTVTALAQPAGKKWEFGLSFSYTNYKFSGSSETNYLLNIPIRAGYFIWKGLEIEPEFTLTKFKGSDTGYIFSTNFSYNFKTNSSLRPYVLVGIGFGNGVPLANLVEGDSEVKAMVINAGAGIKYLIGNSGALRLEYRYTHDRLSYSDVSEKDNLNLHQLLMGISLFF
jgi:opacity protein-like surface antigen